MGHPGTQLVEPQTQKVKVQGSKPAPVVRSEYILSQTYPKMRLIFLCKCENEIQLIKQSD